MNRLLTYFFFLILAVFPSSVSAQEFFLPAGVDIFVTPNDTLTVQGRFDQGGAVNITEASLFLGDEWNKTGALVKSNSTFGLIGDKALAYTFEFDAIQHFVMQSSAKKSINKNLTVNGKAFLKSGILNMNSNILEVNGGDDFVGGSNTSFVEGSLVVNNPINQFYPIGYENMSDGTDIYAPVYLTEVTGTGLRIGFEAVGEDAMLMDDTGLIESISMQRFWRNTLIEGDFTSAKISLPLLEDEGLGDGGAAVVLKAQQTNESTESIGQGPCPEVICPPDVEPLEGALQFITSRDILSSIDKVFVLGTEADLSDLDCIPNVFSTDATAGIDQTFKILCPQIDSEGFQFTIYNRWGTLVYETTELTKAQEGWDGVSSVTGQPMPRDVYEYVLLGKFTNGKELKRQGVVQKL